MGAWFCIVCDDTGAGPKYDLEARKHGEQTGHGTTTCLADGPFAQRSAA